MERKIREPNKMPRGTRRKSKTMTKSGNGIKATGFRSELWAVADALETNDSAKKVLGDETLRDIALQLKSAEACVRDFNA